ncbi:sulfuric ester hydrolase [Aureococcus anophagefferens]|nr:sulfuric ester hydrolase [Aureococcus anophagefferens]
MGANAMQRHGNTPNVTWGTGFHSGPSLPIVTRAADVRKPTKPNPMAITNGDNDHVHPDWVAIDNCDAWLRNRDSDAPFFLHCSLNIPHPSFETNATWLKAARGFWDGSSSSGDHGEMNMEHRQVWKNSMYEASARVPLILGGGALPARLKRGSVEAGLAAWTSFRR